MTDLHTAQEGKVDRLPCGVKDEETKEKATNGQHIN